MPEMIDAGFVDGLVKLVGIEEEEAKALIDNLDIDQLNELAAAVANNDKRRALQVYYLVKDQKVAESVNNLNVGDIVYVGKKKARVRIPNGPGDTVGVMRRNKLKMVKRNNISLSEDNNIAGVLGMTMLPGLARMQELAGLEATAEPTVNTEVLDDDEVEYEDHMAVAMNAISALRDALPEIALKDAKIIRKSLNDLLMSMNESAAPKGRKLKE